MTTHEGGLPGHLADGLKQSVKGRVLVPGDPDYDAARALFNGMIDRRPAAIVQVETVDDVRRAVETARAAELPLSIRGGGHNVTGNALCDGGIVIDFSRQREVTVDPVARVAHAQPGATWGDFDRATQAHGLATTGGLVSTTGIAGFTLGGGIGWLMRKHGLAADNLSGAAVVTAEGDLVETSAEQHPDLLWGLRGGGGNFGVVTRLDYRLHPLGEVLGGLVVHPLARAREVLAFFREFVTTVPDELTAVAAILTHPEAGPVIGVAACYCGDLQAGERALRALREFGPPLADQFAAMPYAALQTMLDESAPAGMQNYWKADFVNELSDATIDTIVERTAALPSPLMQFHVHHMGGAVGRVPAADSAFAHRDSQFINNFVGMWAEPADSPANIAWVRSFWDALRPASAGAYINYMSAGEEARVASAYGQNLERLVALKDTYDPTNLFRLNINVKPSQRRAA
jgi:FAD/FMN-containing dehydrogenase